METFNFVMAAFGIALVVVLIASWIAFIYMTRNDWIGFWPSPRTILMGLGSFTVCFFIGKVLAAILGLPL